MEVPREGAGSGWLAAALGGRRVPAWRWRKGAPEGDRIPTVPDFEAVALLSACRLGGASPESERGLGAWIFHAVYPGLVEQLQAPEVAVHYAVRTVAAALPLIRKGEL